MTREEIPALRELLAKWQRRIHDWQRKADARDDPYDDLANDYRLKAVEIWQCRDELSSVLARVGTPGPPVSRGDLVVGGQHGGTLTAGEAPTGDEQRDEAVSRGAAVSAVQAPERDQADAARSVDSRADLSVLQVGGLTERAFRAGYHCQWSRSERRYIFDPAMTPGDPGGAYRAWLEADGVGTPGPPPAPAELVTCSLRYPDWVAHGPRLDCQHEMPHLIAACGAFAGAASGSAAPVTPQEPQPQED